MIDDDVARRPGRDAVGFPTALLRSARLAGTNADVLDHDVVRLNAEAALDERDARARRGLPRDREERLGDLELLFAEIDDTADFEDDDARAFGVHCGGEGARAARI